MLVRRLLKGKYTEVFQVFFTWILRGTVCYDIPRFYCRYFDPVRQNLCKTTLSTVQGSLHKPIIIYNRLKVQKVFLLS